MHRLPARFVIHTVGPIWDGGRQGEAELLASCYRRCMELAAANGMTSIAFPGISTGIYGYPVEEAARVAASTVRQALPQFPTVRKVIFCCFSPSDLAVYEKLLV